MAEQSQTPNGDVPAQPQAMNEPQPPAQAIPADTVMSDATTSTAPHTAAAQLTAGGNTPQPARSTPARATSQPSAPAPPLEPLPTKAKPHGAPARQYLNEKVTGVLLEGMKRLALDKPEDPLRVLGEFLLAKSRELEGQSAS